MVAASISLAALAAMFGLIQLGRAREEARDAASFRTVLATLGGTGFKVGTLQPATHTPVAGSVVAYESSHDQSFVVVFVRTPHLIGRGPCSCPVPTEPPGTRGRSNSKVTATRPSGGSPTGASTP